MPKFTTDEILNRTKVTLSGDLTPPTPDVAEDRPDFSTTLGAAFRLDNDVVNVYNTASDFISDAFSPQHTPLPDDFNVIDNIPEDKKEFARSYVGVTTEEQFRRVSERIDSENADRQILSQSSGWATFAAEALAGTLSPIALVGAGTIAYKGLKAGQVAANIGRGAVLEGASVGTSEAILHATQETRTREESAINTLAGSIFGTALGGITGALGKGNIDAGTDIVSKALNEEKYLLTIDPETNLPKVGSSVGAARAETSLTNEGLATLNNNFAKYAAGAGIEELSSPIIRGLTSKSTGVRQFTNTFYDHNFTLGKDVAGEVRVPSAEIDIRRFEADIAKLSEISDNIYLDYMGTGKLRATFLKPENKLTKEQFMSRSARRVRDPDFVDEIPEVNKVADLYRADIDKMAKRLVESDLLDESLDVKTAKSYLTRVYNKDVLQSPQGRSAFRTKSAKWLKSHKKDGTVRNKLLDDNEAFEQADAIYDTIMGLGDHSVAMDDLSNALVTSPKFTKGRTFLIPDSDIEEFLVNDVEVVASNYLRKANAAIAMKRSLDDQGFESLLDFKKSVNDEYNELKIKAGDDVKEIERLEKSRKKDLEMMDDSYRVLSGNTRGNGWKHLETIKTWNYLRLLGGVTISSIPELAMPIFRNGLYKTLKDGWLPLITSKSLRKMNSKNLKDVDALLNMEMNNILRSLHEPGYHVGMKQSAFEKGMDVASGAFSKLSGIDYWTKMGRRVAGQIAMGDSIRGLKAFRKTGTIDPILKKRFNQAGINENMYSDILKEFDRYGDTVAGSPVPNWHLWENQAAKKAYQEFVLREVDAVVLRPTKGDVPLFVQNSSVTRFLTQFKTFSMVSTNKMLLSAVDRLGSGEAGKVLQGVTSLVALGALSKVIKDQLVGRESDLSPDNLILEGISRSGIAGLIGTTALDFGMTFGDPRTRRFAGETPASLLGGPSIGLAEDAIKSVVAASDGKLTESEARKIRGLFPFMNLFYIKYLIENNK